MHRRIKSSSSISMADLMAEVDAQMAGIRKGFNPGELVDAKVVSVEKDFLVLDVRAKMEGFLPVADMDQDAAMPKVGDTLPLYFVEMQDGAARFTTRLSGSSGAVSLPIKSAQEMRMPIEGTVEKEVNGGYEVRLCGERAFCPFSQIGDRRERAGDESPVGKKMTFIVEEYDPGEGSLVVSRRAVIELDKAAARERLMESLAEGDIVDGTVTALKPFGAFVDIGGIEGLVPMREISWDRNAKIEDILSVGGHVRVSVISLDWAGNRFTFSLKSQQQDPWLEFAESHEAGSCVDATITKLMPFGAFAQVAPGVEGLIPVALMGEGGKRVAHPRQVFAVGQSVEVQVDSIEPLERKMSLRPVAIMRANDEAAAKDAAAEAEGREALERLSSQGKSFGSLDSLFGQIKLDNPSK